MLSTYVERVRTQAGRILTALLAAVGLCLVVVTVTPLVHWWGRALSAEWGAQEGSVMVVLGGASLGDGILGENSYWRSVFAVQEFRRHSYRLILLSGGGAPEPVSVAMRDFLRANGIPESLMEVETKSQSTRENALFLAERLRGETGVVLVTSDYHMRRAVGVFRRAGLTVIPRPYPDAEKRYQRWERRWSAAIDLMVESLKVMYYQWQGWI